jgi:hypothetical protein
VLRHPSRSRLLPSSNEAARRSLAAAALRGVATRLAGELRQGPVGACAGAAAGEPLLTQQDA